MADRPNDQVAAYIEQLWREMLDTDSIDHEASFYDAGGNSMLLVRMLVAVAAEFACELDYEAFLLTPTLSKLHALIIDARTR